jgi:hypothetical protein
MSMDRQTLIRDFFGEEEVGFRELDGFRRPRVPSYVV